MDIQEKKLKLIEDFLRISDEQVLDKLEAIIRTESQKLNEPHEMIDEAKLDYQNGRVTSHEDFQNPALTGKIPEGYVTSKVFRETVKENLKKKFAENGNL